MLPVIFLLGNIFIKATANSSKTKLITRAKNLKRFNFNSGYLLGPPIVLNKLLIIYYISAFKILKNKREHEKMALVT